MNNSLQLLFSGGRDCVCRIWDTRTNKEIQTLSGHTNAISCVLTGKTYPFLITGSYDGTIKFWDLRSSQSYVSINCQEENINKLLRFTSDNSILGIGRNTFFKLSFAMKKVLYKEIFKTRKSLLTCLDHNINSLIVIGDDRCVVQLWNYPELSMNNKFNTLSHHRHPNKETSLLCIKFDNNGAGFISADTTNTLKLWKTKN
mmetsp:Transcript_7599/g.10767  ORF Transcript_7599/g.10767 Transcript_7599/m.10767 type:complete len:201 (+) Transcript_7599:618-1220(+)